MQPKISIILPVRDGENYLAQAIISALEQDYESTEVIVINDGSQDQTDQILNSFTDKIRVLHQENQGVSASRNRGALMARGEYLAFLDHDDLWEKSKLRKQMEAWERQDSDPLVFCQMQQFFCPTLEQKEREKIRLNQTILPGYLPGGLFVSKQRFLQVGFFLESRDLGEFIEWYARALDLKVPHIMLNEVGLYRRIHQSNMGRQSEIYPRESYLKTLKLCLERKKHLCNT